MGLGGRAGRRPLGPVWAYLDAFGFVRHVSDLIAYRRSSLGAVQPFNVGNARVWGRRVRSRRTVGGAPACIARADGARSARNEPRAHAAQRPDPVSITALGQRVRRGLRRARALLGSSASGWTRASLIAARASRIQRGSWCCPRRARWIWAPAGSLGDPRSAPCALPSMTYSTRIASTSSATRSRGACFTSRSKPHFTKSRSANAPNFAGSARCVLQVCPCFGRENGLAARASSGRSRARCPRSRRAPAQEPVTICRVASWARRSL